MALLKPAVSWYELGLGQRRRNGQVCVYGKLSRAALRLVWICAALRQAHGASPGLHPDFCANGGPRGRPTGREFSAVTVFARPVAQDPAHPFMPTVSASSDLTHRRDTDHPNSEQWAKDIMEEGTIGRGAEPAITPSH